MPTSPLSCMPQEVLCTISDFLVADDLIAMLKAVPCLAAIVPARQVTLRDDFGKSALHRLAMTDTSVELLNELLSRSSIDSNEMCQDMNDPLSYALFNDNEKAIKALLRRTEVDANSPRKLVYNQTPLTWAIANEKKDVVDLLLNREDLSLAAKTDSFGRTQLSYAAEKGDVRLTQLFLAPPNTPSTHQWRDGKHRTALTYASMYGHTEIAQLLLLNPSIASCTNVKDGSLRSPLSHAYQAGHLEIVKLLLPRSELVDDIFQEDNFFRTPLSYASEKGRTEIAKLLVSRFEALQRPLKESFHASVLVRTPFSYAVESGDEDIVRLLLSHPLFPRGARRLGPSPLSLAASNGHANVLKFLLSNRQHLATQESDELPSLLSLAAGNGHKQTFELLLSLPEFTNRQDDYLAEPLYLAVYHGQTDMVRLLLPKQKAPAEHTHTPQRALLPCAADIGNAEIIKMLLDAGVCAQCHDDRLRGPVSHAARRGHTEAVRMLLSRPGIPAHGDDINGKSPLHYAVRFGHAEIVKLLLNHAAEADLGDGATPLLVSMDSYYTNNVPVIQSLLDDGNADVNAVDEYGWTVLYKAVRSGSTRAVELLLSQPNIDVNKTTAKVCTPFVLAMKLGYEAIAMLLLEHVRPVSPDMVDMAARNGLARLLKSMLPSSSYPAISRRILLNAINSNRSDIVEILFRIGVEDEAATTKEDSFLWSAVKSRNPRLVMLVLDYHDERTDSPEPLLLAALQEAALSLQPQVVRMLLDRPNARIPRPEDCLEASPLIAQMVQVQNRMLYRYYLEEYPVRNMGSDTKPIGCFRVLKMVKNMMLGLRDDRMSRLSEGLTSRFYITLRCHVFLAQMLLDRADGGESWSRYHFPRPDSKRVFLACRRATLMRALLALRDKQTPELRQRNLTPLPWARAGPDVDSFFRIVWYLLHTPGFAINVVGDFACTELLLMVEQSALVNDADEE